MRVPFDSVRIRRDTGAALVVTLTLVGAGSLLAASAMRDLVVESAMTRQFALRSAAGLTAFSALEYARATADFPETGSVTIEYQPSEDSSFSASVTIRFVGEAELHTADPDSEQPETVIFRHYELIAESRGPRNSGQRRLLHVRREKEP